MSRYFSHLKIKTDSESEFDFWNMCGSLFALSVKDLGTKKCCFTCYCSEIILGSNGKLETQYFDCGKNVNLQVQ